MTELPLTELIGRLSHGGAERCEATMAAIETHGDAAVMPMLVALDGLGDRDDIEATRQRAALLRMLGRLGEPRGVLGHLFAHLRGAGETAARWALVELCARHPSAPGALLDFVPDAHDPRVPALFAVLRKLDVFERPEVVATMARWLDDAPDDWTLSNIEVALAAAGEAAAPACEALLRAADRQVEHAGYAAGLLALAAPLAPRVVFARVEHLLATEDDDHVDLLCPVLAALPRDDAERVARCRDLVRGVLETHETTACIDALGELSTSDDIQTLRTHLQGWSGQVVSAAIALRKLGDDALPEHLQRAAASWDAQTAREIAEAVGDGDLALRQALLEARYPADDPWIRLTLATALGEPIAWLLDALDTTRLDAMAADLDQTSPGVPHHLALDALHRLTGDDVDAAASRAAAATCHTWWARTRELDARLPARPRSRSRRDLEQLTVAAALAWLATMPADHATRDDLADDLGAHIDAQRDVLRSALGVHAHAGLLALSNALTRAVDVLTRLGRILTGRAHLLGDTHRDHLGATLFARCQELNRLQRLFPAGHPDEDLADALATIHGALSALARPHWRTLLPERLHRELTAEAPSPDTLDAALRELRRRGAAEWVVAGLALGLR